jgi:hypothetical protein
MRNPWAQPSYLRLEYEARSGSRAEITFTVPLQHRESVEVHHCGDRIADIASEDLRRWLISGHQPWAVDTLIWRVQLVRRRGLPTRRRVSVLVVDEGDCPLAHSDVRTLLRMTAR